MQMLLRSSPLSLRVREAAPSLNALAPAAGPAAPTASAPRAPAVPQGAAPPPTAAPTALKAPKAPKAAAPSPPPSTAPPGDFHGCERVLRWGGNAASVPSGQALRLKEAAYFAADAPRQCDYSPEGFWSYQTGNDAVPDAGWQDALAALVRGGSLDGGIHEPADLIGKVPDEQLEGIFARPAAGLPEVVLLDASEFKGGRGTVRAWGVSEDGQRLEPAATAVRADCGDPELAGAMTRIMRGPEGALRCCRTHAFQDSHARKVLCRSAGTVCGADVPDPEAIGRHRRLHARFAEVDAMASGCAESGGCVPAAGSVWRTKAFLEDFGAPERRRLEARLPGGPSNLAGWKALRLAYRKALAANDAPFRTQWLASMGCRRSPPPQ